MSADYRYDGNHMILGDHVQNVVSGVQPSRDDRKETDLIIN